MIYIKKRPALSRRTLLRGLGGVAIGLPFLDAMRAEKVAKAAEFPTRFVVFFTANGTNESEWMPTGTENDWQLSPILQPMADFKEKLLVLTGFDSKMALNSPGDGHQNGMGCMLTGRPLSTEPLFCLGECAAGMEEYAGWATGASIDQYLAQQPTIGGQTKFPSVEFGVQVASANVWSRMSYQADSQPVPPEDDPAKNFDRIFAELSADPFGLAQIKVRRQSVLDAVGQDYDALVKRLGKEDKRKVDAHLNAVREVEKGINKPGGVLGGSCQVPTFDDPGDFNSAANYPKVGKAQLDLMAMTLACDLSRVVSIQWDTSVSNVLLNWVPGVTSRHHDLSHFGDNDGNAQTQIGLINKWYAEQFAYFCNALDAIPEGDGTLLDNTVVLWCNELGKGNAHTRSNLHWVLAGGGGGYFKTGRFLEFDGDPHNNLLVSIAQSMGVDVDTFGDPEYCTGPMTGLKA